MKKFLILALLPLLFGCKAFQKEVIISRDTIQNALDKQFPYDKSFVIARLTLSEPEVYFKNTNVGINLRYAGNFLEKSVNGKIDLNEHIRYEKGKFYFDSLEIMELTMEEKEFSSEGKLKKSLLSLIRNYLECFPVYSLKQTNFKQSLAKLLLKDITIDGDNLMILIGL